MNYALRIAVLFCSLTLGLQAEGLHIFAYHNVVGTDAEARADSNAITSERLAGHFTWLKNNGYAVVGLDQLIAARQGGPPLPSKAVMLTFDDGFRSHYDRVLPLLKVFRYKAVFAIVSSWMDQAVGTEVNYDNQRAKRANFMSWEQLQDAVRTGLVEVASHTHDSHRGIMSNPQGSIIPAIVARQYLPDLKAYESPAARFERLQKDLATSHAAITRHLGQSPRSTVWPYGRFNDLAIAAARKAGFQVMFGLGGERATENGNLERLNRTLIAGNPDEAGFAREFVPYTPAPLRAMNLDLDQIYSADPAQCDLNLGRLLDRVKVSGANAVFLKTYVTPKGSGKVSEVYFPNRHLALKTDLFSRTAWQLHTRCGVSVYAKMPLETLAAPARGQSPARQLSSGAKPDRGILQDLYEDLGAIAIFQGILFHDDITAGPTQKNPASIPFSLELAAQLRAWQPELKTAHSLYSPAVLGAETSDRFFQSYKDCLAHYDYAALLAFPLQKEAANPTDWLSQLANRISPKAMDKTVFDLTSLDWQTRQPMDSRALSGQFETLQLRGAKNLAYHPDDYQKNHPDLRTLAPWFSMCKLPAMAPLP